MSAEVRCGVRGEPPITPLPVPREAAGIVLFGGSFDPPHRWHVVVAQAACCKLFGDDGWIVVVPAARSPLKQQGPQAEDEHRVAMVRLAFEGVARSVIWTDEIDRTAWVRARTAIKPSPSYTIETVERLHATLGVGVRCRLLIGADQAVRFHEWRESRRLLREADPCVVLRPPVATREAFHVALNKARVWSDVEIEGWLDRVIDVPVQDFSSTEVRAALASKGDQRNRAIEKLIDPRVREYIDRHGLYRT